MATTNATISRALKAIGHLGAGESPDADTVQDALVILQRMVRAWAAEPLTMYALLRTAKTLTSGTRDYTIGSGGDINIVRPEDIEYATYIDDATVSDPFEARLVVYSDQQWASIPLKTYDAAIIYGIYYDHAFSATERGTISTYPTINKSNTQIVLYTQQAITGFTVLTTDYVFPPAYDDAIHYNFCLRLAPEMGVPVPEGFAGPDGFAATSFAVIKRANNRPVEMTIASGLPGCGAGGFDVRSGGYLR